MRSWPRHSPRPDFCRVATAPSRWNSARNIDDAANQRVLALDAALAREADRRRDRDGADLSVAAGALRSPADRFRRAGCEAGCAGARLPVPPTAKTRRWRIPVVYGGEHGIDLEDVAKTLDTTPDDIVARHVAGDYRVAMIGFTPGWSYLSGLEDRLQMPRRQNPRLLTPAGTISIGGVQTGVQCLAGPSGWHLLGQTAVRTYQLHRDPIFLLEPGDYVTFSAVDAKTFAEQDRAAGTRRNRRRVDRLMSKLVISAIGPASSVQDGGRYGAQRYGLTPSGAMDRLGAGSGEYVWSEMRCSPPPSKSARSAPRSPRATARFASRWRAHRATPISPDAPLRSDTSMTLADGETLTLGFARGGSFSYLAIEGGIAGEPMFGSLAVNARAGLGSPYPRPLQAGDELQAAAASGADRAPDRSARRRRTHRSAWCWVRRTTNSVTATAAVSGQRVEDIGDQRPHGLSARRSRHQTSARPQHRLRRHRERQHPGARQRRSPSC